MTETEAILAQLRSLASEGVRKTHMKHGGGERVLGVKMGDLRALAAPHKKAHGLGLALWDTGWFEARVVATMVLDPKRLDEAACVRLVESAHDTAELDKLTAYVLEKTKGAGALCDRWLDRDEPLLGRAGWNLMTGAVEAGAAGLDLDALLAKIEAELPAAPRAKKEAMNMCLVMIGVHHPAMTEKAVAAGERLGRWDDRPVPKGCTSSYPPEWIPAAIRLRAARAR